MKSIRGWDKSGKKKKSCCILPEENVPQRRLGEGRRLKQQNGVLSTEDEGLLGLLRPTDLKFRCLLRKVKQVALGKEIGERRRGYNKCL